jgi:hypothetical protein
LALPLESLAVHALSAGAGIHHELHQLQLVKRRICAELCGLRLKGVPTVRLLFGADPDVPNGRGLGPGHVEIMAMTTSAVNSYFLRNKALAH